jgi:hypothetical protein
MERIAENALRASKLASLTGFARVIACVICSVTQSNFSFRWR